MFSTTIKRSVATLGVVAGLLAAAVPASAIEIGTTETLDMNVKAPAKAGPASTQLGAADDVSQLSIATAEVFELNTFGLTEHEGAADRGEVTGLEPNALGTQVGSEGVKAPTNAEGYIVMDWDYGGAATAVAAVGVRENGSQGAKAPSTSGRPQGVIWDLLEQANAGTQVGSEGVKAPASPTSEVFTSVSNVALLGGIVPGGAIISA